MSKFNVGDRVTIKRESPYWGVLRGREAEVVYDHDGPCEYENCRRTKCVYIKCQEPGHAAPRFYYVDREALTLEVNTVED